MLFVVGCNRDDASDKVIMNSVLATSSPKESSESGTASSNSISSGNGSDPFLSLTSEVRTLLETLNESSAPLLSNETMDSMDSITAFGQVWDIETTTQIDLAQNSLTGAIPPELSLLTALTEISLYENAFTGPIPSELAVLIEVTRLSLSQNSLSGTIPAELGMMSALTQLTLYENSLTGPIPSELALLTELTRLSISENDLDGSIPSELGLLTALTTLTLNVNQLTGTIPTELGMLTALMYLSLSNNNLSGPLPSEMGQLTALTSLYLTNNEQLTGTIPDALCGNDDVTVSVNKILACPGTPKPTPNPTPVPAPEPVPVPAPAPTYYAPGETITCTSVNDVKCCEQCWTNDKGTYCEEECDGYDDDE